MLPFTAPHDSVPPQSSGDFGSGLQASPELAGEEAVSAGLGRGGRRGTPPPFLVSRRRNALESRFCFHVSLGLRGHLGSRLSLWSALTDGICSRGGLRGAPQLTGPKRHAGEVPSGVSAAGLGPRRPLAGACHACGVLSCPAA